MLKNEDFAAEKAHVMLVDMQDNGIVGHASPVVFQKRTDIDIYEYEKLRIPKRPHWDETTTKEELDDNERKEFLAWRRYLADLEEGTDEKKMTPFEKNLGIWRN